MNQRLTYEDCFKLIKRREVFLQMLSKVPGQERYRQNTERRLRSIVDDANMTYPGFSLGLWIDLDEIINSAIAYAYWQSMGRGVRPSCDDEVFYFGEEIFTPWGVEAPPGSEDSDSWTITQFTGISS